MNDAFWSGVPRGLYPCLEFDNAISRYNYRTQKFSDYYRFERFTEEKVVLAVEQNSKTTKKFTHNQLDI